MCIRDIHTHLHVKEDLMQLYGFLTRDELRVFRLLIGVSGIGPKGGLGILSALGPDDLRFAVASNDVKAIPVSYTHLNIQITVGIKKDGTINGVSILSISETAGLGMKATEPSFYNQYVNKKADKFVVSKDGGDGEQIDALSGATITSRAVTGAVNTALGYYQNAFK